jgi:hypothetical protein
MHLARDAAGDFVIEAEALASRLGLSPQDMQRRMRLGFVTSLVERGTGEDQDRVRLTVRCGRLVWRALLDRAGRVIEEATELAPDEPELAKLVRRAALPPGPGL